MVCDICILSGVKDYRFCTNIKKVNIVIKSSDIMQENIVFMFYNQNS